MNELQEEQAYSSLLKEARTQELDQRTLQAFNTVTLDLVAQEVITEEQRRYVWEILLGRIEK